MKRIIGKVLSLSVLIGLLSCAIMEEAQPIANEKPKYFVTNPLYTKGLVQDDSLQRVVSFQTDKTIMLLHQIKKENGRLLLDLSETEVYELALPDSLYYNIMTVIESINNSE